MNPAPSITTSTLATATQGQVGYSQTVVATGGTAPFTWSISSGVLPTGLSINPSTGVISGTVSGSAVSETFTVTATDVNGVAATKSLTISVNIPPAITSASSFSFAVGLNGTFQATATGNPTPTFSNVGFGGCVPTSPPTGVNFSSSGLLFGYAGGRNRRNVYVLCINASNGVGTTATQKFTLTVLAVPNQVDIISLPQTIAPGGTSGSVIVQIQDGSGNPIVQATNLTATITVSAIGSGITPTVPGTLTIPAGSSIGTFTFSGTNSSASASGTFDIAVSAPNFAASALQVETVDLNGGSTTTTIGTITAQSVGAGSTATFTVPVTSNNGSSHIYNVVGVSGLQEGETASFPTGCQTTSGTANFTVTVNTSSSRVPGPYTLVFLVERFSGANCTGTASDFYEGTSTLTIEAPQPPSITSANNPAFTAGSLGTFTVTATGFPAPTFSETGALPTGVTFLVCWCAYGHARNHRQPHVRDHNHCLERRPPQRFADLHPDRQRRDGHLG